MDDRLEELPRVLPTDVSTKLDHTLASLYPLEEWVLKKYASVQEILRESEKVLLDILACYVGETFRKNLGGIWSIELKDKKFIFYQLPVVKKQGCWTECPLSLVTASTDRRSGTYMAGVLQAIASQYPAG